MVILGIFVRILLLIIQHYRNMKPEEKARKVIDKLFAASGWQVVDREHYAPNISAAAIGLQNVDGLSVSEFLIQLARQQIEGKITMEEVTQRLNEHYKHRELYSSTYEIVPPDSEMIQQIKEENELRRPKMYEQDSTI